MAPFRCGECNKFCGVEPGDAEFEPSTIGDVEKGVITISFEVKIPILSTCCGSEVGTAIGSMDDLECEVGES